MKTQPFYDNRQDAGQLLASFLNSRVESPVIALSLPRGGTIVAAEIAKNLKIDHRLIMVRKIGSPYDHEIAIGALAMDGKFIPNQRYIEALSISPDYIENQCKLEHKEITRRLNLFSADTSLPNLKETIVILIDDGIATGYTLEAALCWLQSYSPKQIILAVPVAPADTITRLAPMVNLIVCPFLVSHFTAVGNYYDNFKQISDTEVQEALR